ncbi:MAG: hypothetical protein JSS82_14055 [Bacteroidetes bacterium]|nr:hypothetical protein [Bacteroidota bacterium]
MSAKKKSKSTSEKVVRCALGVEDTIRKAQATKKKMNELYENSLLRQSRIDRTMTSAAKFRACSTMCELLIISTQDALHLAGCGDGLYTKAVYDELVPLLSKMTELSESLKQDMMDLRRKNNAITNELKTMYKSLNGTERLLVGIYCDGVDRAARDVIVESTIGSRACQLPDSASSFASSEDTENTTDITATMARLNSKRPLCPNVLQNTPPIPVIKGRGSRVGRKVTAVGK